MHRRKAFVSIVDDSDDENIDKVSAFCNYCSDLGFYHKLGPRIYPKDQPLPHDHDLFLQCYNCGRIENRVHAKQQNEITPIVDPPKSIHESNIVTVLTTRHHKERQAMIERNKRNKVGYSRSKDYVDVDLDLRSQLGKGKKLVSYSSSNDAFEG